MESVITTPADAAAEPAGTSKYGWRVVLFSGAGWFFDGYVINVWPLAIPFVMTDLHLTVKDIGTITTLYVTAYMLGTLLGGTFADYLGRRSVLSFSVLFYMFVDALTAVARGFWSLGFFRFMTGTGTGMELPVGSTFITEAVHNRWRARLLSVMGIGYPAGYVLAIGAFATIGAVWGWRAVFVASIIPGIAVFFIRLKVSESPRFQTARERLARGEVKRDRVANITVFRKPYVRDSLPAVLYWIGNAFAFWAFYTFIPLYLVKVRLISTPVELTWLATYQIWAVVITYLGAWLSDRRGRRPFAIMFAALTLVAVWSITLVPSGVPLYLAGALLFGFNGATWTISFAHSTELYPTHIRGSGIGTDDGLRTGCVDPGAVILRRSSGPLGHRRRLSPRRPCLDPHDHWLSAVARDQRDRAGADQRTGRLDGGAVGRDTAAAALEVKLAASYPVLFEDRHYSDRVGEAE